MKLIKKIFLLASVTLLLTSCLPTAQDSGSTPGQDSPTSPALDRSIYKSGLIPEYRNVADGLPYASMYEITFNIADDLVHITGGESIRYTNAETVGLSEIKFRLFPNLLDGEMHVDQVLVNDNEVTPNYTLNDSLLSVPLAEPLLPKDSLNLKLSFSLTMSQSIIKNYGVESYYENVLALAHAYPMIAVYDDEGWNAEIPPQSGDITYADMSFFLVTVDAPKNLVLAASGNEINRQNNGSRQTVSFEAGPVRDFYLAASPDYEIYQKESNGVLLKFYAPSDQKDGARFALETAARALDIYGARYTPYPYTELDLVSTPTRALGVEYPGIVVITDSILDPKNYYLEATVAHEVGHQWFYNVVGSDQLDEPWLDESITQFVTLQYFIDAYGVEGSKGFRSDLENRWGQLKREALPIGLPVRSYSEMEYSALVYGRGPFFFEALREKLGEREFDLFMKNYVESNAWGISTPSRFKTLAEHYCACDLTPLFAQWILP